MISIFVLANDLKVIEHFDPLKDSHCKYQKVKLLCMWIDVIYDKKGYSPPVFTTLNRIKAGFRRYLIT
jgi:hypothetical protein